MYVIVFKLFVTYAHQSGAGHVTTQINIHRVPEPTGPVLATVALTKTQISSLFCHQFPPVRCWSFDNINKHTPGSRAYRSGTGYGCPHKKHRFLHYFVTSSHQSGAVHVTRY